MDMMSARDHTMFAESIIGEFSQRKKSSPNASVAFISNLIKSKRNGVLELISDRQTHDTFQQILSLAVHHGRKIHSQSMEMQKATSKEILARSAQRKSTNEKKNRRKIDNIIKKLPDHSLDSITKAFPEIPVEKIITIQRLLHGTPDSMIIRHDWEINQVVVKYYGIIRNFIFPNYTIYYYQPGKYDQGNEENVNFSVMAADFLCEDLDFF